LPVVAWHEIFSRQGDPPLGTSKSAGDVNLSELAVLATAAAAAKAGEEIVEIGTFEGAPRSIWRSTRRRNHLFSHWICRRRDAEICPGGG